jgi:hypothetical protein
MIPLDTVTEMFSNRHEEKLFNSIIITILLLLYSI